jgi:hypothetical protein
MNILHTSRESRHLFGNAIRRLLTHGPSQLDFPPFVVRRLNKAGIIIRAGQERNPMGHWQCLWRITDVAAVTELLARLDSVTTRSLFEEYENGSQTR